METHHIQTLTMPFEGHAQQTENGVEYWLARDLQFTRHHPFRKQVQNRPSLRRRIDGANRP